MEGDKMRIAKDTTLIFALLGLIIVYLAPALAQEGESEVKYISTDFRDPLEFPAALRRPIVPPPPGSPGPEVRLPDLSVEGMVWGSERPQAIIDGEVYGKGDTVKVAEILDISKDGVTLLYKNRKFIVRPKIKARKIGEEKAR